MQVLDYHQAFPLCMEYIIHFLASTLKKKNRIFKSHACEVDSYTVYISCYNCKLFFNNHILHYTTKQSLQPFNLYNNAYSSIEYSIHKFHNKPTSLYTTTTKAFHTSICMRVNTYTHTYVRSNSRKAASLVVSRR